MSRPTGIRLIIGYKAARALLQLAAAVTLFVAARDGRMDALVSWALAMRQQVGHLVWGDVARVVLAGAQHLTAVGATPTRGACC